MPRATTPGPAFTVDFPTPLPAERRGEHWWMEIDGRELRLSNLDKVFWPDEGYTKGDLVAYYYNIAPRMLPYLAGRPLTMKRMPNGIGGQFFYMKDAPSHTPPWMPRCPVESVGEEGRWGRPKHDVIDYLMVEDAAGLLFMANLGCIEFHPLHSRCASIDAPDYLFFDLDPFEPATFEDVLAVAGHVRVVCENLGLTAYPKISGATGMQIYVPLVPGAFTYDQVREFVGRVGHLIRQADPDRVTMEWQVERRAGKVFIDHNMNRIGANIAAVYSVRPEAGATVSTPVTWKEVEIGRIRPGDFTIASVWSRFGPRRKDPFRGVLDEPQDVSDAMTALGVERGGRMPDAGRARSTSEEVIARSKDPKLARYLKMRAFGDEGTPEPAAGTASPGGNAFVIQRHDATRLHYDLRLERDGVLVSWAVPKGLPFEKGVKHLAVHVEDHPMEYGGFEGTIPKGHYGAGEVRIWDHGTYDLLEWTDSKVSFRLHGQRHHGEYHLVRTRSDRDWIVLMAKASDEEPLARPPTFAPMLAASAPAAFDGEDWWFEPKLDGIRTLLYIDGEDVRLVSRTGRDQSAQYPELKRLYRRVTATNAVLDGEIVATDEQGGTSFERLQQRMNLASKSEIERMVKVVPVEMVAFDLLWLDGRDLTREPLTARRELLTQVVMEDRGLRLIYSAPQRGVEFFEAATALGLEGIIAKRTSSRYLPGRRSDDWRKIKILSRQDCVILGWTPGQRGRASAFGALLLGAYRDDRLLWIGQVGTGFTERMLKDLLARLKEIEADRT
jgi:DNA ligase D-like protein (predicted ligase)/DNA ligase D-like protein (predicted polymerase)/DNA ligase D-like protein (predicted 3'-phosphoesterase)